MSLRAKASVIAFAAACLLVAPAAMASSHGPVQVTGKQLRSALLPASDFVAGYSVSTGSDSGRKLEHGTLFNVRTMSCKNFWLFIGTVFGLGRCPAVVAFPRADVRPLPPRLRGEAGWPVG